MNYIKICATLVTALVVAGTYIMREKVSRPETLKVWTKWKPYSADPMQYDAFVHHITFRPVLLSLVTMYSSSGHKGMLAESWNQTDSFKKWSFKIRKEMRFENGDLITPEVIVKNFTRVAFLMKKMKSESELFSHLNGRNNLKNANSKISGISFSDNTVVLEFDEPVPNLIDKISFGIYSIAHPSNFNAENGDWLNPKEVIASGPYSISSWTDDEYILNLRTEFPKNLLLKHPIKNVTIKFNPDISLINSSDIVIAPSYDLSTGSDFTFHGPVSANMAYVTCFGWKTPGRLCNKLNDRKEMRDIFYDEISKIGYKPMRSFFPTAMSGIVEAKATAPSGTSNLKNVRFKATKLGAVLKSPQNAEKLSFNEVLEKGYIRLAERTGATIDFVDYKSFSVGVDPETDFEGRVTGILIDNPRDDIKFMFLSKNGANVPDADGSISEILKDPNFDPQEVNRLVYEQAIVWPLTHFSFGIWVNQNSRLDINELNQTLPPTDFQWIGWK